MRSTAFRAAMSSHSHRSFPNGAPADLMSKGSPDNNFDHYRNNDPNDPTGRTMTYLVTGTGKFMYASAARLLVLKVVASMSASADVLALSTIEVDMSGFAPGTNTVVKWRGKPVFIKRRTEVEQGYATGDDAADMRDKQTDKERVQNPEFLVVLGVCTHLGCVPIHGAGDYPGGFFCPCHGSHYDASARIRKGPAPLNLEVPTYKFLNDTTILIG